jgi:hypothetical protein
MATRMTNRSVKKFEATAGVCFLVLGLAAPVLGGLLTVIEWMLGRGFHPRIHVAGTALLIVGIPLILLAGFCLDWSENAHKRTLNKS